MRMKLQLRHLCFSAPFIGMGLAATPSQANTLAVDLNFYSAMVQVLNLTAPVQQIATEPLRVTDQSQGSATFLAFCAEPFQSLSPLSLSTGDSSYSSAGPYSGLNGAAVQALFNGYFGNALSSITEATAFQLALWELVTETGASISTGSFAVAAGAATTRAQQMLDNISPAANSYTLSFYASPGSQDILSAVPVPEASTYSMMALGLGIVGFWGLRKKTQKR